MVTDNAFSGDTLIMMYDGTTKKVKDVKINDKLLTPNGNSTIVKGNNKKEEIMYYIYPVKGSPYTVSEDHLLVLKVSYSPHIQWNTHDNGYKIVWLEEFSLRSKLFSVSVYDTKNEALKEAEKYLKKNILGNKKYRQYGDVISVKVSDFINLPKKTQNYFKGFTTGIDFEDNDVEIDPYILGYWLGDGHSYSTGITTAEPEIVEYFTNFAKDLGLMFKKKKDSEYDYCVTSGKNFTEGANPFLTFLKKNNLIKNKHIPDQYKFNSRKNRLELLAGLIDSDGHYASGYYDFTLKSEKLADDVIYLARSLGFFCYKSVCQKTCTNSSHGRVTGTYYRFSICGEGLNEIPSLLDRKMARVRKQKKNASVTGFQILREGKEKCYQIKTDSNRLLLDDFTVVHK